MKELKHGFQTKPLSTKWQKASHLIAADSRFPDGFKNLGISPSPLPRERCVAYPYFLEEVPGSDASSIQEFLVKLGVTLYFGKTPMHYGSDQGYINSLNIPEEVKANCSWKDADRDELNTAYIADKEILNSLRLPDLIKLLLKSGYDEQVCAGQQINWFNMRFKGPVTVDLSYAAYLLRTQSAASQLKYYAVKDHEWLPGKVAKEDQLELNEDDPRILGLLLALGASATCADFGTKDLYQVLQERTDRAKAQHDSKGLKSFYHKIKMALNEQTSVNPPADLRLACKIGDELQFLPANEIFYSDNIGIRSLRNSLPIIEMSSREGEDIVKRVFGCRLIKDLKFELVEREMNPGLTDRLNQRLATIKPYVIASATKEAGSKGGNIDTHTSNVKSALDRLYISVVSQCEYRLSNGPEGRNHTIRMENGDLRFFDGKPFIYGEYSRLEEALEDPYFCNCIVEAIAIALNLNGGENADRFLRLLKSSKKELDYIAENEFDESLWAKCEKTAGLSSSEVEFWRTVFEYDGIADSFDEEALKKNPRSYLVAKLGIEEDRADIHSFITYHRQQLKGVRSRYEATCLAGVHALLSEMDDEAKAGYVEFKENFLCDDWIEDIAKNIRYEVEPDYEYLIENYISYKFDFEAEKREVGTLPRRHDEYLLGHDFHELRLSPKDESFLYFDGYEDYFARKIEQLFPAENEDDENDNQTGNGSQKTPVITEIEEVETIRPSVGNHSTTKSSQRRQPSETAKKRNGRKAEDIVFRAFSLPDSDYEIGEIYSEYLAAKNGLSGDDSRGYDLEYRKKGSALYRCLEIKNCSSGEDIRLTAHEYEVSQSPECRDRYDVALVTGDSIRIWKDAFKNPDSYSLIPEG